MKQLKQFRGTKTITNELQRLLPQSALDAMSAINAQRQDWLLYLRLLRRVTHHVRDEEARGEMIGVIRDGQPLSMLDLFELSPACTERQLQYRVRKLIDGDILIRRRTRAGWRLAVRFCSPSTRRRVAGASMEHFPWPPQTDPTSIIHGYRVASMDAAN